MQRRNTKGFTLIELLVVIAIIGLLSTLAVVALNSARTKSRDAKRVSDIKQVQTALELYYADNNAYPTEASGVELGTGDQLVLCSTGWDASACAAGETTNMGKVPDDPIAANAYTYTSADGTLYSIAFSLETDVGSLAKGAHTATPDGIN